MQQVEVNSSPEQSKCYPRFGKNFYCFLLNSKLVFYLFLCRCVCVFALVFVFVFGAIVVGIINLGALILEELIIFRIRRKFPTVHTGRSIAMFLPPKYCPHVTWGKISAKCPASLSPAMVHLRLSFDSLKGVIENT